MIKLTGPRIILRDWQATDLADYRSWNIGHHRWMDFNGPYYPRDTAEELEAKISTYQSQIETGEWPNLRERLVIADQQSDQMLGTVSWYWQSIETNWRSIGIAVFDEGYWGKGIGYEALDLWISYLFQQDPSLVRLDLRTWSGNHGMMKLGKKLGFKEEARFRMARIVDGEYYDSIGMGILREEWEHR